MRYLYFDESIHDRGEFIVGAVVVSDIDLSGEVSGLWERMGMDPTANEYKSSAPKASHPVSRAQREHLRGVVLGCKVGLLVCPLADRKTLGTHASQLIMQLHDRGFIGAEPSNFYLDQGISFSARMKLALLMRKVNTFAEQDSRLVAGLQVADYVAHSLAGMLLEEMGITSKRVTAGSESGYNPTIEIELGY